MFGRTELDALLDAICDRLEGEWLIIGGAIATLWFSPRRTTEDVDILGVAGDPDQRYAILELAVSLGLPVESLNSAADFFVRRIADWRDQLVVFREGAKGRVYRPTATLFLLLKVHRLDERDLEDCRALIATGEPFDRARIRAVVEALPPPADAVIAARRAELLELVGS
jgi:hypothetical protein